MIVSRENTPQTNQEWMALPPLGQNIGSSKGKAKERSTRPVINRTPAQAAAARLMTKPPNLKIYAAALKRDKMDENIIMEGGPFVPPDINRGDWINAMIKDHKIAKHTANALLLYLGLDSTKVLNLVD
jgi:hypothetical protein